MWSLALEMILISRQEDATRMNILSFCEAGRNNLWKAISRKIVLFILFLQHRITSNLFSSRFSGIPLLKFHPGKWILNAKYTIGYTIADR